MQGAPIPAEANNATLTRVVFLYVALRMLLRVRWQFSLIFRCIFLTNREDIRH